MLMGRIKVVLLCWYLILVYTVTQTDTKVSTACYGPAGISCTEHTLTCSEPLIISITNITFGYRRGCGGDGVSSCSNTACCNEQDGDCFTPYNQNLLSQLQQTCSGKSTCTLNRNNGLTEVSLSCGFGNIRHSYSKIEYQCVTESRHDSKADTDGGGTNVGGTNVGGTNGTNVGDANDANVGDANDANVGDANDANVGGIVGGIVGVILVITIVGVVILFYIRRDKKDTSSTKDGHHRRNVPNQRYQTDSALARNITLHYADIDNTTCPSRTNPPSGDDYDYIPGDNHVKQTDHHNYIGQKTVTSDINLNHTGEDNYHHIGGNQSNTVTDDAYNHIGEHDKTGLDSGGYHHIGGNLGRQGIMDVTYNHISGSPGQPAVADGTYNRIGDSHGHPVAADGTYNHVGDSHGHPVMTDGTYNHIGDSHGYPVVNDGTYNHIKGDHKVDKQEGDYSLAKHH